MDSVKLYDTDFLIWSETQAQLLRDGKFDQLDLENLIEEVEDLGKSELKTCLSLTELIMLHLLYLRYWETEREYNEKHWQAEIDNWRIQLKKRLTGSFKNRVLEQWDDLHNEALITFQKKSGLNISIDPIPLDEVLSNGEY